MALPTTCPQPVLLFDSECGLCNAAVDHLLRWDTEGKLSYAPLNGPAAEQFRKRHNLTMETSSIILVPDWHRPEQFDYCFRTTAVLAALRVVEGPQWLIFLLRLCPVVLSDLGYRIVARLRRRLMCGRPADKALRQSLQQRFLD
jgi:predicted DCC family thiol-disulfide oxidoreductase YuxK